MNTITEEQYLKLVTAMIGGICANPASGNLACDSYGRQLIVSGVMSDVAIGLSSSGIRLVPND